MFFFIYNFGYRQKRPLTLKKVTKVFSRKIIILGKGVKRLFLSKCLDWQNNGIVWELPNSQFPHVFGLYETFQLQ